MGVSSVERGKGLSGSIISLLVYTLGDSKAAVEEYTVVRVQFCQISESGSCGYSQGRPIIKWRMFPSVDHAPLTHIDVIKLCNVITRHMSELLNAACSCSVLRTYSTIVDCRLSAFVDGGCSALAYRRHPEQRHRLRLEQRWMDWIAGFVQRQARRRGP